jgi:hypothetical protein
MGMLLTGDERSDNSKRIIALWNAADGMTNEDAVRYLEHGKEMNRLLIQKCFNCRFHDKEPHVPPLNCKAVCEIKDLFNKMEGK